MNLKRVLALVSGLAAIAAVVLLLVLGVFPGAAGTGSPVVSTPDEVSAPIVASAAIAPAVQETASAPGSPQEGIQVHGHWTIEVRNPDGTLAEHREFDNALRPDGAQTIASVLGRLNSVGGWRITLAGSGEPAFLNGDTPTSAGWIVESTWPGNQSYYFKTLTISVPASGANLGKLVLSGTATAHFDGRINFVGTWVERLDPSVPPSNIYGSNAISAAMVTETILASPVNLIAGQQVLATVVISFS